MSDKKIRSLKDLETLSQKLALEKHTYEHRLKNILDIVEGKTEDFYGFL